MLPNLKKNNYRSFYKDCFQPKIQKMFLIMVSSEKSDPIVFSKTVRQHTSRSWNNKFFEKKIIKISLKKQAWQ